MNKLNLTLATLGAALIGVSASVQAGSNPFAAQELPAGYSLAMNDKTADGSCGEAKCGAGKAEGMSKSADGSCGEAKCGAEAGASKKTSDGSCGEAKCGAESGASKKTSDASCGEAKCGAGKE